MTKLVLIAPYCNITGTDKSTAANILLRTASAATNPHTRGMDRKLFSRVKKKSRASHWRTSSRQFSFDIVAQCAPSENSLGPIFDFILTLC